jgi:hypothetical protein
LLASSAQPETRRRGPSDTRRTRGGRCSHLRLMLSACRSRRPRVWSSLRSALSLSASPRPWRWPTRSTASPGDGRIGMSWARPTRPSCGCANPFAPGG